MNISWGTRPSDAVGMHVAAWVLGESLMHLATVWRPAEVPCCLPRPTLTLPPDSGQRLRLQVLTLDSLP